MDSSTFIFDNALESDISINRSASYTTQSRSLFTLEHPNASVRGNNVPKFTRNMVVSILSECMNELSILRSINLQNDLGTDPENPLTYTSIEDRYMGQENHADFRINSADSNFDKLAKDINIVYVALMATCLEIKKNGSYKAMENTVQVVNRMHQEEEQLLEDEANKRTIVEELRNQYEEERLDNIRTIEETNAKIHQLKFQSEDIYIYARHEVEYFDKWQKARFEQNGMKCRDKEFFHESTINDTKEKIAVENRCHSELVKYLEETRNDYMDEIQQWMKLYDDGTDQREEDIIKVKADLEKIVEERKIQIETYEKRAAEIEDWMRYKKIKEQKEVQRAKEIRAATRIQAWWRGVMVRKKLGPYRKKGKGKGKGKDKGKKGKKK